jgi:predicted nucleic acid-binding protein
MKVYLDACCLCRLFDNHQEHRIRLEAEAVLTILKRCTTGWEMIESTAVLYEIGLISDIRIKKHARSLVARAHEVIRVDDAILSRAAEFEVIGLMGMDAIHVACAEQAGAILLTTDNELIKIMKRNVNSTSIAVKNPLYWLMEVDGHGTD